MITHQHLAFGGTTGTLTGATEEWNGASLVRTKRFKYSKTSIGR